MRAVLREASRQTGLTIPDILDTGQRQMTHRIVRAVASVLDMDPANMLDTGNRHRPAVWGRWAAAWLLRQEGLSYPEIRDEMGGTTKGHTSALQYVRCAEALLGTGRAAFVELVERCGEGAV